MLNLITNLRMELLEALICNESVLAIYNSTQLLMIPDANENGIFTLNNYCNMLLCWCGQFQHLSWIHDVLERSPQPHRQQHCSLTVVKVKWATEDREHCIITTLLQKLVYKMLNNDQESTFNIVCVDIKNSFLKWDIYII